MPNFILITGRPGTGKTTIIKKLIDDLKIRHSSNKKPLKCAGFYTEEIRNRENERIGFDVVPLDIDGELDIGNRSVLARISNSSKKLPKIGKYSVYVEDFEKAVLPILQQNCEILIVDEIGKMELLSRTFEKSITNLLDKDMCVIATIPISANRPIEIVEKLKNHPGSQLFTVTKQNRNAIYSEIYKSIENLI